MKKRLWLNVGLTAVIIATGCAADPQVKEIKKPESTANINIVAPVTAPSDKVKLEWKFFKDNTYKYKMTQEMISNTSEPTMGEQKMAMKQEINYSQKVMGVNENGAGILETTYNTVNLNADIPMLGKIKFDSTNPEDIATLDNSDPAPQKMLFRPFMVMLGKKLTVNMDKSGQVIEVKGISELMDELLKGNERFADQIKASFNEKWYTSLMTQANTRLPGAIVAKGESWTNETEIPVPMAGNIKLAIKSTYMGSEIYNNRNCARIDDQITLSFNLEQLQQLGDKVKIEWSNNNGIRKTYFDFQVGQVIKSEANMRLTMDVTIKSASSQDEGVNNDPNQMPPEMKIKNDIFINTTLELQE
ncbi:MAG: DUF6263 family protein [Candidatus Brocadiia bacterium]